MHDTKEAAPPLPHSARVLTQAEEKRLDIYLYHSPKANGRLVTVVEPCRLAIALALEFDPDVTAFVERPRSIAADDQNVELCFWIRRSDNSEQYVLFRRQNKPTVHAVRKEERLCASDVPPPLSSTAIWSPIPHPKEIGREEALFRRADHRLPA